MLFFKKDQPKDPYPLLRDLGMDNHYTPDIAQLERRTDWFFFIADQMMEKHRETLHLGSSAVKLAEAYTQGRFSFFKQHTGAFAEGIVLSESVRNVPFAPIKGEIFLIRSQHIPNLDRLKENGVQFSRERVKLKIPYRKVQKLKGVIDRGLYEWATEGFNYHEGVINSFMYVGKTDYWSPLLDGGFAFQPVRSFQPNNSELDPYYYFTIQEHEPTIRDPRTVLRLR